MKKLWMLCLVPAALFAQEAASTAPASLDPGYHRHDGFYLSMNVGIAGGKTVLSDDDGNELTFSGPGSAIEIRIGNALTPNLIISADLMGRAVAGPHVEFGGASADADDDFTISDGVFGVGLTYYFLPQNIFISGTAGFGQIAEDDGDDKFETDLGFAMSFKVGKEWWVSKNWGLGVSGGYAFVSAEDGDFEGLSLTSNKFFVLFNTTYN